MVARLLCFLGCSVWLLVCWYVIARVFVWFPGCCYAKMFCVTARVLLLYVVARVFCMVARVLQCYC